MPILRKIKQYRSNENINGKIKKKVTLQHGKKGKRKIQKRIQKRT